MTKLRGSLRVLLLAILGCGVAAELGQAQEGRPAKIEGAENAGPQLMGILIGQSEAEVRRELAAVATFAREEEGQQVWRIRRPGAVQYAIVGYDRTRRVRYVTTLPGAGVPLPCEPLGHGKELVTTGGQGSFDTRRTVKIGGDEIIIIAKGPSPGHYSSCSLKKVGASSEEDEDTQARKKK